MILQLLGKNTFCKNLIQVETAVKVCQGQGTFQGFILGAAKVRILPNVTDTPWLLGTQGTQGWSWNGIFFPEV